MYLRKRKKGERKKEEVVYDVKRREKDSTMADIRWPISGLSISMVTRGGSWTGMMTLDGFPNTEPNLTSYDISLKHSILYQKASVQLGNPEQ